MDHDDLFFFFLFAVFIMVIYLTGKDFSKNDKDTHIKNLPPKNDDEGEK